MSCALCPTPFAQQHLKLLGPPNFGSERSGVGPEFEKGDGRLRPSLQQQRGDAPSPLAFAKSCKGGDVSVLDPALAWDVRCIYLFIQAATHREFKGRSVFL